MIARTPRPDHGSCTSARDFVTPESTRRIRVDFPVQADVARRGDVHKWSMFCIMARASRCSNCLGNRANAPWKHELSMQVPNAMSRTDFEPLISAIVISFNHGAYVADAIRSIWQQDYRNAEIIFVDDGSVDNTVAVARSLAAESPLPMTILQQDREGLNRACNRALEIAKGDLVALLAADDAFAPRKFQVQAELFSRNPNLRIAFANGRFWFREGLSRRRVHDIRIQHLLDMPPETVLDFLQTNVPVLLLQTCLIRRELLLAVGGWDEEVELDDWPLHIKMFSHFSRRDEYTYVDADLVLYRRHGANLSRDVDGQHRRILQVISKYTPSAKRPCFLSRMQLEFARQHLRRGRVTQALQCLVSSQRSSFRPLLIVGFVLQIVVYPFRAIVRRFNPDARLTPF